METFKQESSSEPREKNLWESLKKYGADVKPDQGYENAYIIQFQFEKGVSTIRILLNDSSGADFVITNTTTLPDNEETRGYGSRALQEILSWAKENNLTNIKAVQVQSPSEDFWTKNDFVKDPEPNKCNDFTYREKLKEDLISDKTFI